MFVNCQVEFANGGCLALAKRCLTLKCLASPIRCIIYKHRKIPDDRIWICPKPTELPVTDNLDRCSAAANPSRSSKYK